MNVAIVIGRLTRDPELRHTQDGTPVADFTVAVDRNGKGGDTDFIDVTAWRKLAEQVGEFAVKGRLVGVVGRLQIRAYETKDGQKRKAAEIVASQVRFLDSPKKKPEQPVEQPEAAAATEGGRGRAVPF